MDLSPGQLVADRFEVLRSAGRGERHQLFEVLDRSSGRRFGLKIIDEVSARNAKHLEDFRRQGRVATEMRHPHLLAVIELGEHRGLPFALTEYAPGDSLAELLRRKGRLGAEEALSIARQLCSALSFLHQRGVIHRDIRPDALALGADGRWKLRDFEMARDLSGQQTIALPGGAPPYRSPEHLLGRPLDARSDLYSVGALLFEMLTGETPLKGVDVISRFMQPPPKVRKLAPETPEELAAAVERCLEPEAEQRFAGVGELLDRLGGPPPDEPAAEAAPPEPEPQPQPEPLSEPQPEPQPEPAPAEPALPEPGGASPEPVQAQDVPPAPTPAPTPAPEPREPAPQKPEPRKPRRTLADAITSEPGRALPVVATLQAIIRQLAKMRDEGVYHAALSPSTIYQHGDVYEVAATRPPEPGQTVAVTQPKYRAPEWLLEAPVEPAEIARADLYALGFIAYEWLAGRDAFVRCFPHEEDPQPHLAWMRWQSDPAATAPPLAVNRSWVPAALGELIDTMIAKEPAAGMASYEQADQALGGILARIDDTRHATALAAGGRPQPRPADKKHGGGAGAGKRRRWIGAALAALLLLLAAVAAWRWQWLPRE